MSSPRAIIVTMSAITHKILSTARPRFRSACVWSSHVKCVCVHSRVRLNKSIIFSGAGPDSDRRQPSPSTWCRTHCERAEPISSSRHVCVCRSCFRRDRVRVFRFGRRVDNRSSTTIRPTRLHSNAMALTMMSMISIRGRGGRSNVGPNNAAAADVACHSTRRQPSATTSFRIRDMHT